MYTPSDVGLPAKFTSFRPGQAELALAIATDDNRFVLVSAPTGSGKSVTYTTVAQLVDARVLILTANKGLQQQLGHDFGAIGLVDIRGMNNYRCVAVDSTGPLAEYGKPGMSCDEGPCHLKIECPLRQAGCLYYDAVSRASSARLVVTNYAYWMTMGRYGNPDALGEFDMLVLDEAHEAPDQLADFCAIRLRHDEVRSIIGESIPPIDEDIETWIDWAKLATEKCREVWIEAARDYSLARTGNERRSAARYLKTVADLGSRLKELSNAHKWMRSEPSDPNAWVPGTATDWVAEKTNDGALFSPVWAHAYAEDYLFRRIPRVVLASATLQKRTAVYLGIPDAAMSWREVKSSFDPRRRPLIYIPTTTVDRNMTEGQVRMWVNRVDSIIAGRLDRKGIIHTRSYDRMNLLFARSKYRHLMLTHTSQNARDVVEKFKRAATPCILVSPSMEEGYDFPHDYCRYQILAKVPFVDSRSPVIKARAKSDKTYLNYLTTLSIIQQVGRGMRAEDDWCENFIIDDHIEWFWPAAKKLMPNWFRSAYRVEQTVPKPPAMKAA